MVLGASIRGQQLQTDGADKDCQAACRLGHPLQRRIRVWLCQPDAQWASDSTLSTLRRGEGPEAEELIVGTNGHNLSKQKLNISFA